MTADQPVTFRQMAGMATDPPNLADAIVVVIDAQREYTDGTLPLDGVDAALDNIQRILDAARNAGSTVIHVAHRGDDDGTFTTDGSGRIVDRVAPIGDEPVVVKGYPNAFNETPLRALIAAAGDRRVVMCGFMTHMCISASARAALDLGVDATVIADACATRALPSAIGGAPIAAATLHEVALTEIGDLFALVVTTDHLLGS